MLGTEQKDRTVSIFATCSKLLIKIAVKIGDDFFSELCVKEADKLLSEFIEFLKKRVNVNVAQRGLLRHENISTSDDIAQHKINVAQYYPYGLIFQIKEIINLSDILKHLKLTDSVTPLLLEKNLLFLELSVLNLNTVVPKNTIKKRGDKEVKVLKPKIKIQNFTLSGTHNKILSVIKSKDKIRNLEIFSQFPTVSKRTLKRKLSELIISGAVTRQVQGKKVFYAADPNPALSR